MADGNGDGSVTLESLTAKLTELTESNTTLAESNRALTTKVTSVNEESKGRRLKIEELTGVIEANSKKKANESDDVGVIRTELTGIIDAKVKEITTLKQAQRDSKLFRTINSVASEHGAVNSEQVATLIKQNVRYDDNGNVYVLNTATGQALNDASGRQVTVKEYAKTFLDSNPHFIKASGNKGAGSAGSTGGGTGNGQFTPEQIKNMSPADYQTNKAAIDKQYFSG